MKIVTIDFAVEALHQGEVIAYPTEGMYGLGCDPFNTDAITKILTLKQREIQKGFILVASSWKQLQPLVKTLEPRILAPILDSWPGPVTWVFPANTDNVSTWIRGTRDTIAVRVSDHPVVKALCEAYGKPIVSTSANQASQPPIRDYQTLKLIFGNHIQYVAEGTLGKLTRPTTIKDAISGEIIRA